jgi:hypothetical protein
MAHISTWEKFRKAVTGSYSEKLTLEIASEEARAIAQRKALRESLVAQAKEAEAKHKAELEAKAAAKIAEVKAAAKPQPVKKAPAKKVVAFDPKAKDADGDGKLQDGTIHERPAPAKKTAPKKKGK